MIYQTLDSQPPSPHKPTSIPQIPPGLSPVWESTPMAYQKLPLSPPRTPNLSPTLSPLTIPAPPHSILANTSMLPPAHAKIAPTDPKSYAECPNGFIDVSSSIWQPTHTTQSGTYQGSTYDYVAIDETAKTYDAHYLIGNFYFWNAATAGSGGKITDKTARDSICPKNWRLPTTSNDGGDFPNLFNAYALQPWTNDSFRSPLYLTQAGFVHYSGKLQQPGTSFNLYSSSPTTNNNVCYEGYSGGTAGAIYRSNALPVRCLAR